MTLCILCVVWSPLPAARGQVAAVKVWIIKSWRLRGRAVRGRGRDPVHLAAVTLHLAVPVLEREGGEVHVHAALVVAEAVEAGLLVELETKVHMKVRNHGEGLFLAHCRASGGDGDISAAQKRI